MFLKFCYWFYLIHIPVTILIDSSVVIPPLFSFQQAIINFHISTNKDILLINKPSWFIPCIWVELIFQLPFFIYAVRTYESHLLDVLNIVYGVNAGFSTFVCVCWVYLEGGNYNLSPEEVFNLVLIYVPYVLIPVVIGFGSGHRILKRLNKS